MWMLVQFLTNWLTLVDFKWGRQQSSKTSVKCQFLFPFSEIPIFFAKVLCGMFTPSFKTVGTGCHYWSLDSGLLDAFAFLCLTDIVIDFYLFYFVLLTFYFLPISLLLLLLFGLNWDQNEWIHLKRVFFLLFFFSPVRAKLAGGPTFLGKAVWKKLGACLLAGDNT